MLVVILILLTSSISTALLVTVFNLSDYSYAIIAGNVLIVCLLLVKLDRAKR